MASLPHFCVPYTVSTMRISGYSIFKRLPQGNKAGEQDSLCQMEGGWYLTYAFYGKMSFYYNLKKTYKKLVMTWISRTWGQVKLSMISRPTREYTVVIRNNVYLWKVLTTYS